MNGLIILDSDCPLCTWSARFVKSRDKKGYFKFSSLGPGTGAANHGHDSVALVETVGSGDQVYSSTTVGPDGSYVPGHVYRCPNGTGSWTIGAFDPVGGNDTPGAANDCPVTMASINEIRIEQPGGDDDEYFEL